MKANGSIKLILGLFPFGKSNKKIHHSKPDYAIGSLRPEITQG
jgi:hypothetical protein